METEEEREPTLDEEIEKFYTTCLDTIETGRGSYWYGSVFRRRLLGKYSPYETLLDKASRLEGAEKSKTLSVLKNLKKELTAVIKEVTEYRR